MDKIMIEKVQSLVAWRGVAWRGVRACFAYLLTVLVILSQVNITAFADGNIEYIGSDGNTATISEDQATSIASDTTTWGSSGEQWFVANGDVTINDRVEINGDVHLILKDGSKLTINGGIHLTGSHSLTIYGQSGGTGELIATSNTNNFAGIGGNNYEGNSSLTINGGNITATGGLGAAGIGGGHRGSGENITINGGDVTATGLSGAGIGGGFKASGGTITITGGKITATGGRSAAGIGGGDGGAGGNITINGGDVTATGEDNAAGIGGGNRGSGGTVTVSGGIVTATGGQNAAGIGGGNYGGSGTFTTGANGSAVIYASSISDKNNQENWSGVIFEGDNGKVYGSSVTPNTDFEIPSDKTLEIENGEELVIGSERTLTNNGIITNNGTITNNGKIINKGKINGSLPQGSGSILDITLHPQSQTVAEGDTAKFIVGATGTSDPTYQWQVKTTASADWQDIAGETSNTYIINSVSSTMNGNQYRCKVTNDLGTVMSIEATLTIGIKISYIEGNETKSVFLSQVTTITGTNTAWGGDSGEEWYVTDGNVAIDARVNVSGNVHLILKDGSTLTINKGIELRGANASLTIYGQTNGTGHLNATGMGNWAGIVVYPGRSLTIYGGRIEAKGGNGAAGIGGVFYDGAGTIKIHGGDITATGGSKGAGIGGGYNGDGGTITIQGGKITATGGEGAAGIGGGMRGGSGTFTTGTNGSAVIYTNSISDRNSEGSWSGVIFEGDNGKVYGTQVTPNTDFEIPSGKTLEIDSGKKLVIPAGKTLTNDGTITNNGTIINNGQIEGMGNISGNLPLMSTPSANIDYSAEQLTGLGVSLVYKITAAGGAEDEITSSADGKIDIREAWFNKTISIKTKATNSNFADSLPQEIAIPSRHTAPSELRGIAPTLLGQSDGKITGTTDQMEYKQVDGGSWTTCANGTTSSLVSGTYHVRTKATISDFASEAAEITIADGPASSSGSDSGSTSGSYSGSTSESNNDTKTTPIPAEILPIKVDANGNATITKDIILKAIEKAKAEAKNGKETVAKISIETGASPKSIKINIKSDALKELVSSNIHRFVIDTDRLIDLGFNSETLKELKNKTKGDIIFSISKTKVTSSGARKAIGGRPVYDISILESKNGKETKIESLNGKTLSLSIPYTATKKEETGKLYAVYVDKQGKVEWLTKSSYDKDKKAVLFETNHFSIYGVGYQKTLPNFKDINNHWAKEDILFVVSREMLSGTDKNTFSPDVKLTRGMFVTALGRLSEIDTENYKQGRFVDVKENKYYTAYVNWAEEQGIVNGTSKDTFSPDKSITREEMAVILKNYAEKQGYTLPKTLEEIKFTDDEHISDWAKEAVKEMQKAGILQGKINNGFDPKGEATRAEASALLHRFVEIVIDPQSANGWTKNDSGQISYYKDGQAVKGWFKENGKTYWFNKKQRRCFETVLRRLTEKHITSTKTAQWQ